MSLVERVSDVAEGTGPAARAERTAGDIMSAPVVVVSLRDSLWTAWRALYEGGFRHLVVVDGSHCVGVIDDRRIVLEWPLGILRDNQLTVADVMRQQVRCVLSDVPIAQVARIMLRDHTDAVPVVSHRGEIVGLVTATDLVTVMADSDRDDWGPTSRTRGT
jgi:acetoin utilization protein AcuB